MRNLKDIITILAIAGLAAGLNAWVSMAAGTIFLIIVIISLIISMRHLRKLKKLIGGK